MPSSRAAKLSSSRRRIDVSSSSPSSSSSSTKKDEDNVNETNQSCVRATRATTAKDEDYYSSDLEETYHAKPHKKNKKKKRVVGHISATTMTNTNVHHKEDSITCSTFASASKSSQRPNEHDEFSFQSSSNEEEDEPPLPHRQQVGFVRRGRSRGRRTAAQSVRPVMQDDSKPISRVRRSVRPRTTIVTEFRNTTNNEKEEDDDDNDEDISSGSGASISRSASSRAVSNPETRRDVNESSSSSEALFEIEDLSPSEDEDLEEDEEEYIVPEKVARRRSGRKRKSRKTSRRPPKTLQNNGEQVRRSGRDRVSTVMKIQGETVLRTNNYVMKGMVYEFGAFEADKEKENESESSTGTCSGTEDPSSSSEQEDSEEEESHKPSTTRRGKASTTKGKSNNKEHQRVMHNNKVKARIVEKAHFRNSFLARNVGILKPFLEGSTKKKIINTGTSSSPLAYVHQEIHVQPDLIQGELRDYQLLGLDFLWKMHNQNLGMILGDEMGLGKTLQTISLLCYLKEHAGATGPSLIVCPLSVLSSWCREMAQWAPSFHVLQVHSSNAVEQDAQRKQLSLKGTDYDVIITTYEMVKNPQLSHAWRRIHFNYVVLDEGHKIKAHGTQMSQAVRKLHCENRLLLTGTPLQNNLVELWSLLNFLHPDVFTTQEPFEDAFSINAKSNSIDKEKMQQAQRVLDLFMLRRLKTQVEKLMPKKIETKVYCPLSKTQVFWYKALLLKDMSALARMNERHEGGREQAKTSIKVLQNLIMQLRKCCLHPYLFDGAETDINQTTCKSLIAASGKLAVLDMLLRKLFTNGHRCVLFSQFTSMLDIIQDYCESRGWVFCRLDGSTSRAKRNFLVQQFNAKPTSPYFIFLMSTRSGGCGLNLQSADTCILFDSDWNPQMDMQAMARVHRIGQTRTVHVYRLVSGGTVEERVLERAEKKLLLDQMVNRGSSSAVLSTTEEEGGGLSAKELFSDIKFGCNAVFGKSSENELPSTEDIEFITDRNRTEEDSKGRLKGNETKNAETFDAAKELTETQTFDGVDFRKVRNERQQKGQEAPENLQSIASLWQEVAQREKRQVKNRIVMVETEDDSGHATSVPVLAENYDFHSGESSVRKEAVSEKKKRQQFDHYDWCQFCGDGGDLIMCPYCPVVLHIECCGIKDPADFRCCPHHRCVKCDRSNSSAGGMLFPCAACTQAFCEDCLPRDEPGLRFLSTFDDFEKLGYNTTKNTAYILCSAECEKYAIEELEMDIKMLDPPESVCPSAMDVSFSFGQKSDEVELPAPSASTTTEDNLAGRPVRSKAATSYSYYFDKPKKEKNEGEFSKDGTSLGPAANLDSDLSSKASDDSSVSSACVLSESSEDEGYLPPKSTLPVTQPAVPSAVPKYATTATASSAPRHQQQQQQQQNPTLPSEAHNIAMHNMALQQQWARTLAMQQQQQSQLPRPAQLPHSFVMQEQQSQLPRSSQHPHIFAMQQQQFVAQHQGVLPRPLQQQVVTVPLFGHVPIFAPTDQPQRQYPMPPSHQTRYPG